MSAGFESEPPAPPLNPGEVHLWPVRLDVPEERLAVLAELLDPTELERAQRMRFEHLRRAATVSAAGLRRVLARYCGLAPAQLRFSRSTRGKPNLTWELHLPLPRFNLAHSADLALIAVSGGREVGVDLERIEPERVDGLLVERALTARERTLLDTAAPADRARLFFEVWTHKEALMKATGMGLALDPLDFEVLLADEDGRPRLATLLEQAGQRWSLQPLDVGVAHSAALAVAGGPARVRALELEPATVAPGDEAL